MGLLRNLAKKVVGKVAPPATPTSSARPAPAAPPPQAAAPRPAAVPANPDEPVADAESLARMEAGAQEVRERVECGEPVVLLDVREPFETATGIIPGAKLIPLGQLQARWKELEHVNEVVVYCAHGQRSYGATKFLREQGIFNATSMEGGISAWAEIGGRIVPPTA